MTTLVSPGVSVTVTNESFFVPASAPTVPLFIIATGDNKYITPGQSDSGFAIGTQESGVVRTITSLQQSVTTYGIPSFLTDTNGNPMHGDARNEYGLAAVNTFLNAGSLAYVVRACVNLDDNFTDLQNDWDYQINVAESILSVYVNEWIAQYNSSHNLSPASVSVIGTLGTVTGGAGPIATTTLVSGGTLYTNGTYTSVALAGGTGTGAIGTVVIAGATVTSVTITTPGTGYVIGDILSVSNSSIGGTGSGLSIRVTGITNYTNGTYSNVPLTGGTGTGATANIVVTNGAVSTVTLVNVGSGYVVNDALSALNANLGGSGSGFSIHVTSVFSYKTTIDKTDLLTQLQAATSFIFSAGCGSFSQATSPTTLSQDFYNLQSPALAVYTNGFNVSPTGTFPGIGSASAALVLGNIVGGSSYTNGSYSGVALTGGTGTGATANITVSGGTVTTVVVVNKGSGYAVGDLLSAAAATIGGTGSGFTITVTSIPGLLGQWNSGSVISAEFTATEAGQFLVSAADQFEWTQNFLIKTALGTNDAARRTAIVTALNAIINGNQDIRAEGFQYNLVVCPGYSECTTNLFNLVQTYLNNEVLVVGDTPMNLEPSVAFPAWASSGSRVIDGVNGDVTYYYPHVLTTNLDGASILVPSSAFALKTYAFSDNVSYEWFAPAGIRRGTMSGLTDIGYFTGTAGTATTFVSLHLNQGQRDALYGYTASGSINPLVFFPGSGFLVWGQKTSVGTVASAMDRVNVSRLVKYISRSLRIASLPYVFEPNDALTQQNLKAMVDSFLGNLIVLRGLYDFASICDSTNNTPDVVDANELVIDIAIQPVKAAEFIYVNIAVVATGATIGSNQ